MLKILYSDYINMNLITIGNSIIDGNSSVS